MSEGQKILLSEEEVLSWEAERREALARAEEMGRKLQGFRLMFPELAARILGQESVTEKNGDIPDSLRGSNRPISHLPMAQRPITDVVLYLIDGEDGGRPTRWFRERAQTIPGVADRVGKAPTAISNALNRLVQRGKLRKKGDRYYLPQVLSQIESGDLQEDAATPLEKQSFNSLMHEAMKQYGKPFRAADAVNVAQHVPLLAQQVKEQPSRLYSWLSRELFKNKLARNGDVYFYPSERDEAPNGETAGAPFTGEAGTSLFENVVGFPQSR